jgi:lysozyme
MRIQQDGIDFIKKLEGFRSEPYADGAGVWTQGFGHALGVNPFSCPISEREGEDLLRKDIDQVENEMKRVILIDLEDCEWNALVSFTYNLGIERLKNSTLLVKLNAFDKVGAGKEIFRWVFCAGGVSQGLKDRRQKEYDLFMSAINAKKAESVKVSS